MGHAPDPAGLPRQRRGTTPQGRGRYPDFDVVRQARHWDPVTRAVVLARLDPPPPRFFDAAQAATLGAFCDVVLAQDAEPRVPVLALVDAKLSAGRLDGYRFAGMPDDRQTWRLVARGLDEVAAREGGRSYARTGAERRLEVCEAFAERRLTGGVWDEIAVDEAWTVVMRGVLAAFYSHPWAFNEIGFGGPAYPRGYARMGIGQKEQWEGDDEFPLDAVADVATRGADHPAHGAA